MVGLGCGEGLDVLWLDRDPQVTAGAVGLRCAGLIQDQLLASMLISMTVKVAGRSPGEVCGWKGVSGPDHAGL